ncbi:MAG: dehydrogenase [Firmicutes bacterium HGW-Firmicutes-7]|nr:MAG: dehydrogenase [Firmicutes bacterium HGW-Firmicutes-7]
MKKCIITGGNSGIGKRAAYQIAGKGYFVVLACRNIEQAQKVCEEITNETGNSNVFAMRVDLSLMSEVKTFIKEYTQQYNDLDVLINNAADFDLSRKTPLITSEGNEAQFATNHLAPFALVQGLLPLLKASDDGRIINISSQGLMMYPRITFDFDNIKGDKHYSPAKTYYQTKLAQIMFSLMLKEKLTSSNISVYAIRVTNVKVDMNRYKNISPFLKFMYKIKSQFSISPEEMAKVYTTLATEPKLNGFYYDEKMREVKVNEFAYNQAAQQKLWDLSEKLI